MQASARNIYQTARKAAGITQERAAELLGISPESLRAYETGVRLPPDEVVYDMADQYSSTALPRQHLRSKSDLARDLLPEVKEMDLPVAVMRLVSRIYQFADSRLDRRLLKIAEDGRIDETERPEFDAIMTDLEGIIKSAYEVGCARETEA